MKKKIGAIILVLILAALIGAGSYIGWYYTEYVDIDEIYPGVSIEGMDVGGMSKEQARKVLDEHTAEVSNQTVTLQVGKKNKSFKLSSVGLTLVNDNVVEEAWELGREGNIFNRIMEIRQLQKEKKNLDLTYRLDEAKVKKKVKKLAKKFLAKKKDATITRKNKKFVVTEEVNGIDMDLDANAEKVAAMVTDPEWDQKSIVCEMDYKEDKAEHTKAELSVIKDKLGTFTTSYAGSPDGRCANVENGASLINGTLLYPGDTFSVHDTVTPFTKENGYELAGSYENGTTVQTYGGGICQVSTTLYNAVLRAELEIVERSNHSMTVHYVELSEDAAIAGDSKDFRFKNNMDYPVYIVGSTDHGDRTITFSVYGKEIRDKNRTLEFVSETTAVHHPNVKTIKDKHMKKGKKVVEKQGTTGYSARLWKVIKVKGKEDQWVQINSSSYMSTPKVVRVGTKKEKSSKDKEKEKEKSKDKKTKKKKK